MAVTAPEKSTHGKNAAPDEFPVPARLATSTDLKPAESQAVMNAVNPVIADAFALYTKTKNYHWHLSGRRFRDLHLLFDEHAAQILSGIDVMAERIRKVSGTTIRSISHISKLQTISDDNDEFVPPAERVRRLLRDNRHISGQIRNAIQICEDNRDFPTSNELETILDDTERRAWFLFEIDRDHDEV
jgi:starvation-inducible DNA-binding protein